MSHLIEQGFEPCDPPVAVEGWDATWYYAENDSFGPDGVYAVEAVQRTPAGKIATSARVAKNFLDGQTEGGAIIRSVLDRQRDRALERKNTEEE